MIVFKSPDKLVKFLEQKLPPKIQEDLFNEKQRWEHKGIMRERISPLKPFQIVSKLRDYDYVSGIVDSPFNYLDPQTYILHYSKLMRHLAKYDTLTFEQERFRLISINKACELMDVTRPTIYKLIRDNKIPFVEVLSQKRIQLKDLLDYIDKNKKFNNSAE